MGVGKLSLPLTPGLVLSLNGSQGVSPPLVLKKVNTPRHLLPSGVCKCECVRACVCVGPGRVSGVPSTGPATNATPVTSSSSRPPVTCSPPGTTTAGEETL